MSRSMSAEARSLFRSGAAVADALAAAPCGVAGRGRKVPPGSCGTATACPASGVSQARTSAGSLLSCFSGRCSSFKSSGRPCFYGQAASSGASPRLVRPSGPATSCPLSSSAEPAAAGETLAAPSARAAAPAPLVGAG